MSEIIMNRIREMADEAREMAAQEIEETEAQEIITCHSCGCDIESEDEIGCVDSCGNTYCGNCVEQCSYCGEITPVDEVRYLNNTLRWETTRCACEDCADEHGYICRDCGGWFTRDGIWDFLWDDDDEPICHNCEDSGNYVRCAECDMVMHGDDAYYDEGRDDYFCSEHYHPRTNHLHSYGHTQVSPTYGGFLHTDDEDGVELHYGVELETDKGDGVDDYVDDLYEASEDERLFHCKTDGSLDDGVEIVTNPASFRYMMEAFPFEKIAQIAKNHGYRSHDARTCGLHVHVSRVGLGRDEREQELTTAKLIILFDRFWNELVKFSRRNFDQLERWANKQGIFYVGIEQKSDDDVVKETKEKTAYAGRYRAINLEPRHTIEFRLFRGTLKVSTIRATLQFVQTAIEFAKCHTVRECVLAKWMDFVRSDHEELNAYLKERGLWFAGENETIEFDDGDDADGAEC